MLHYGRKTNSKGDPFRIKDLDFGRALDCYLSRNFDIFIDSKNIILLRLQQIKITSSNLQWLRRVFVNKTSTVSNVSSTQIWHSLTQTCHREEVYSVDMFHLLSDRLAPTPRVAQLSYQLARSVLVKWPFHLFVSFVCWNIILTLTLRGLVTHRSEAIFTL